jgi:hypothetical protein
MTARNHHEQSLDSETARLLSSRARSERQLLKEERAAERRLAAAREVLDKEESRLRRFQERTERRRQAVILAENALRQCQADRAAGPRDAD